MADQPVVKTENLTKKYGEFVALDSLSISLDRGQILGFIGPNGAGKTTMIKILVGLARATAGAAWVAGHDCQTNSKKIKRLVGYMPDTFGSYDNMRVREYLDFFGAAFKIPRRERSSRIDSAMDTSNCSYMRDLYVETLSHGMKQRVGIARTLLHDPEVLILDEPANGLDPKARIEMRELLLRLGEMGKTLIVTSHILPELSRICDVVAMITKGKLRAFGTLDQIMREITTRRAFEIQLASSAQIEATDTIVREFVEADARTTVTSSNAESMVRFSTEFDDTKLADLLTRLIAQNIKVAQYREVVQDLEDAFLSVTAADEQPAPQPAESAETVSP